MQLNWHEYLVHHEDVPNSAIQAHLPGYYRLWQHVELSSKFCFILREKELRDVMALSSVGNEYSLVSMRCWEGWLPKGHFSIWYFTIPSRHSSGRWVLTLFNKVIERSRGAMKDDEKNLCTRKLSANLTMYYQFNISRFVKGPYESILDFSALAEIAPFFSKCC